MEGPCAMGEDDRDEAACATDGFVRNDADKAKGSRARFPLSCAFKCAWDGVAYAVRSQRNMRCASTARPGRPCSCA